MVSRLRTLADQVGARFWSGPEDGQNPYLAWLAFSDVAIVTEDSSNMLSDAAWHGLPVHIARLEGRHEKFDRLHDSLITHGAARWFGVADAIVAKLLERYPQPDIPASTTHVAPPDWMS